MFLSSKQELIICILEYFIVERDNKWFTQNLNNRGTKWYCPHGFDFI